MQEDYQFYIPKNVSTRFEIVKGIGIRELIYVGISIFIGLFLAFIVNSLTNNFLLSVGIIIAISGGTFAFNIQDDNNQSVVSIVRSIIRFYSIQKFYKYEVKNDIDIDKIFHEDIFAD